MKFFTVPLLDHHAGEDHLNRFLGDHRILSIDHQFVSAGSGSFWAICVTYQEGNTANPPIAKGKIDYREVLPQAEFEIFARLRRLRKELAEREGVPAYALFTSEQLAVMVRNRVRTLQDLGKISGIGPARVEKYAQPFLEILSRNAFEESDDETSGRKAD